jgi:hypothetical protein
MLKRITAFIYDTQKYAFSTLLLPVSRSRDSLVGIPTGYGLDGRGSISGRGKIFLFSYCPDRLWGQRNLLSKGYCGEISPKIKLPGREADHSPSFSAEVKNGGLMTTLPVCLRGIVFN